MKTVQIHRAVLVRTAKGQVDKTAFIEMRWHIFWQSTELERNQK